jgi:mannose-6-phosphate isomerase-like protein (cupin superfamily)
MKELERARDVGVKGQKAETALSAFRKQMEEWGLVMPPHEPLVYGFGLDDFERTGLIECWIANEEEEGYCGKFLFVFDGQTCPTHCHKIKVETFFVVRGRILMIHDGVERRMSAGDVLRMNTGEMHSFTGVGPALLIEVSKPCRFEDNYFENTQIPIGGNYSGK